MRASLFVLAALSLVACSPQADTTTTAANDSAANVTPPAPAAQTVLLSDYVNAAAVSDMYEVEAGRLASTRGHNAAVKAFARQMVTDHTATTQGLQAALRAVPNAPQPPAALDQRHQDMLTALRNADAAHFDQTYVDQQQNAHREALSTHQNYAEHGDNETVRAFAAETAPKVQHHIDMIGQIDSSGADEPANTNG